MKRDTEAPAGCDECRGAIEAWRLALHSGWPIEKLCGHMSRVQWDTDMCFTACRDEERATDLLQCPSCGQVWLRVSCNKGYCDCDTVKGCVGCAGSEGESELAATPLHNQQVAELRAHRGLRDLAVNDFFR